MPTPEARPALSAGPIGPRSQVRKARADPTTTLPTSGPAPSAGHAQAISYLAHVGPAVESGTAAEQLQDVLVALAPIVGTARVMAAPGYITQALGSAIAATDTETHA